MHAEPVITTINRPRMMNRIVHAHVHHTVIHLQNAAPMDQRKN